MNAAAPSLVFYNDNGMKMYRGNNIYYLSISPISIDYLGWLNIDVIDQSCNENVFTIEALCEYIALDWGDTISTNSVKIADYVSPKHTVSYKNGFYTITGIQYGIGLGSNTSTLYSACLNNSACVVTSTDKSISNGEPTVVYPNPTNGDISVDLGNSEGLVKIYNTVGALVYTSPSSAKNILTINDLVSLGVYFVHITRNNSTEIIKVIKN